MTKKSTPGWSDPRDSISTPDARQSTAGTASADHDERLSFIPRRFDWDDAAAVRTEISRLSDKRDDVHDDWESAKDARKARLHEDNLEILAADLERLEAQALAHRRRVAIPPDERRRLYDDIRRVDELLEPLFEGEDTDYAVWDAFCGLTWRLVEDDHGEIRDDLSAKEADAARWCSETIERWWNADPADKDAREHDLPSTFRNAVRRKRKADEAIAARSQPTDYRPF